MCKMIPLSGVIRIPEMKVSFCVSYVQRGSEGKEVNNPAEAVDALSRVVDQFSNLSPEMQAIIVEFADYLAQKEEKPGGQSPAT